MSKSLDFFIEDGCCKTTTTPEGIGVRFVWVDRPINERVERLKAIKKSPVPPEKWEATFAQALLKTLDPATITEMDLCFNERESMAAVAPGLLKRVWPRLKKLTLRMASCDSEDISVLWDEEEPTALLPTDDKNQWMKAFPDLTELTVTGHYLLPGLVHPHLRHLLTQGENAVAGIGLKPDKAKLDKIKIALPQLEILSVCLEMPDSDGYETTQLNFGKKLFPKLKSLDLRGSDFCTYRSEDPKDTITLLRMLVESGIAKQLEFLGLPILFTEDTMDFERWAPEFVSLQSAYITKLEPPLTEIAPRLWPMLRIGDDPVTPRIEIKSPLSLPTDIKLPPSSDQDDIRRFLPDLAAAREHLTLNGKDPNADPILNAAHQDLKKRLEQAVLLRDWALYRQTTRPMHAADPIPQQAIHRLGRRSHLPLQTKPIRAVKVNKENKDLCVTNPITEKTIKIAATDYATWSLSPDGNRLAVSEEDLISLYDTATGEKKNEFARPGAESGRMKLGRRVLASVAADQRIFMWDVTSGKTLPTIPLDLGPGPLAICGNSVFMGFEDKTIRAWNVTTGAPQAVLHAHQKEVVSLASSYDETRLVSSEAGRFPQSPARFFLWNLKTLDLPVSLKVDYGWLIGFANEHLIEIKQGDNPVFFDAKTGEEQRPLDRMRRVRSVQFSPDGGTLITGGDCVLWDSATGIPMARLGDSQNVGEQAAFSADGKFVVATIEEKLMLFDAVTRKRVCDLTPVANVLSFVFISNTQLVVGMDHEVILWDLSTMKQNWRASIKDVWASLIAASADGQWVACGSYASYIALLDQRTGKFVRLLKGIDNPKKGVASDWPSLSMLEFSGDGTVLSSGLFQWHLPDGEKLTSSAPSIRALAFGAGLTTFSSDKMKKAVVKPLSDGIEIYKKKEATWQAVDFLYTGPKSNAYDLAFSPDGTRLAVAGKDHVLLFGLNTKSPNILVTPPRPPSVPSSARWEPSYPGFEWVEGAQDQNGKKHGAHRYWNVEGHLHAESLYQHGQLDGEDLLYHPDGTLAKKDTWKDGVLLETRLYRSENPTGELFSPDAANNVWESRSISQDGKVVDTLRYFTKDGVEVASSGAPLPPRPKDVPETARYIAGKKKWVDGKIERFSSRQVGTWRWWDTSGMLESTEEWGK